MSANEIRKGDIGTAFILTIKEDGSIVDVSGATGPNDKQIIWEKPNGTVETKTAEFDDDGVDGKIKYITLADDLDEIGNWEIQGKVSLGGGTWSSDIKKFKVYRNLE